MPYCCNGATEQTLKAFKITCCVKSKGVYFQFYVNERKKNYPLCSNVIIKEKCNQEASLHGQVILISKVDANFMQIQFQIGS